MKNLGEIRNKPLTMATVGDLIEALSMASRESVFESDSKPSAKPTGKMVFGIKGIANELNISKSTVQRFLGSGKFDAAITRVGKTIVADVDALWAIFKCNQKLKYAHQYSYVE